MNHPKMKNTAALLLLCLLILASSVLFLFIAQNEPMIYWVKTFTPSVSQASSSGGIESSALGIFAGGVFGLCRAAGRGLGERQQFAPCQLRLRPSGAI
ncbi:hypothetical protein [Faecalispora sporosphaeroides]|uniref:hypothetical protein n=1 Tax=Faecalispora sporosphaeroides TaxID=1549 RepID=UPI002DD920B3|nr:hypothetical protein [Faecalispora sporosphaeroides]